MSMSKGSGPADPRVSICIPTYNGSEFLRQALDSALAQTVADVEVVVVDDGSTDDTYTIAQGCARGDPRLRVMRNQTNLGLTGNWNQCVRQARGEWIKFLFQDDYLAEDCVARMLDASEPRSLFVVCARALRFEADAWAPRRELEAYVAEHHFRRHFPSGSEISPETFAEQVARQPFGNCLGEPSAMLIHRDAFRRVGAFHSYLIQLPDWEFGARIAVHAGVRYLDEELATFRIHADATTARNKARRRYRTAMIDPLVMLYEIVHSDLFAAVRTAAGRARPPIDLQRRLLGFARATRLRAYEAPGGPDLGAVAEWETVVRMYPQLASISKSRVGTKAWHRLRLVGQRLRMMS
ncbi:MAG: glycosyltransferase family 2 protein [Candidatus Rokuibacteriota bacterium]